MTECSANEPLQLLTVARGGGRALARHLVLDQVTADTEHVVAHQPPPLSLSSIQDATDRVGHVVERPRRQPAQDAGQSDEGASRQPAAARAACHLPGGASLGDRRHDSAAIAATRAARASFSAFVSGQTGLKLYHWYGAAAIMSSSASAIACVARCISAGLVDLTSIGS